MHLKQNNFYETNYTVECYITLSTYVLNPLYDVIDISTWIYEQLNDYSHKYPEVAIGYVYTTK